MNINILNPGPLYGTEPPEALRELADAYIGDMKYRTAELEHLFDTGANSQTLKDKIKIFNERIVQYGNALHALGRAEGMQFAKSERVTAFGHFKEVVDEGINKITAENGEPGGVVAERMRSTYKQYPPSIKMHSKK